MPHRRRRLSGTTAPGLALAIHGVCFAMCTTAERLDPVGAIRGAVGNTRTITLNTSVGRGVGPNGTVSAPPGSELWHADVWPPLNSRPVVSPDSAFVYLGSEASKLVALNAVTGDEKWTVRFGRCAGSNPALSPDGSAVYHLSCKTDTGGTNIWHQYAFDAATGEKQWQYLLPGSSYVTAAVNPDGRTVYTASTTHVYALDATTGRKTWEFNTNGKPTSPTASPDGRTVFVGSGDHHVYAIDSTTGTKRWGFRSAGAFASSLCVSPNGEVVYGWSFDKHLYAIDVRTGDKRWSVPIGTETPVPSIRYHGPGISPDGGTVAITGYDRDTPPVVFALDALTGAEMWVFHPAGRLYSVPAFSPDGSTVYFGAYNPEKSLYALETASGAELWAFATTNNGISASPSVSSNGEAVYVQADDNRFYAVQA